MRNKLEQVDHSFTLKEHNAFNQASQQELLAKKLEISLLLSRYASDEETLVGIIDTFRDPSNKSLDLEDLPNDIQETINKLTTYLNTLLDKIDELSK